MMAYAEMRECRHARIADYFGEKGVARRCSACDNCLAERPPEEPVPVEAVMGGLAGGGRFRGRGGLAHGAAVGRGRPTRWSASPPRGRPPSVPRGPASWKGRRGPWSAPP